MSFCRQLTEREIMKPVNDYHALVENEILNAAHMVGVFGSQMSIGLRKYTPPKMKRCGKGKFKHMGAQ